jgi:hypothetical protein
MKLKADCDAWRPAGSMCGGFQRVRAAGCCARPGDGGRRLDSKSGERLSWVDAGGRSGGREGLHALALGTRRRVRMKRGRGGGGGLEQCGSRRASCVRDSQGQTRRRRSGELKAIAGSPVDVDRPCAAARSHKSLHCCCVWKACTDTCSASGGACSNGLSPMFTRYRPKPDNSGDKKGAVVLLNAAPLGAAKLPLTAAPLNMPQRCLSLGTAESYC